MGSIDLNGAPAVRPNAPSAPEVTGSGSPEPGTGSPDRFEGKGGQPQSKEELAEEARKIRRLQMVVNMVTQVIAQDPNLGVEEASEMVADTRRVARVMFPDKELAFNLIFWPRLQRLMRERYRMQ